MGDNYTGYTGNPASTQGWTGPQLPDQVRTGNRFQDAAQNAFLYDLWANQFSLGQNRPDYRDPYGGSTWNQTLGTDAYGNEVPVWEQEVFLNPTLQAALDAQHGLTRDRSELGWSMFNRVGNELSDAPDWSGLEEWRTTPGVYELDSPVLDPYLDYSGAHSLGDEGRYRSYDFSPLGDFEDATDLRERVEGEYLDKATSRLDPMWEQRERNLVAQLAAQGLRPGDQPWDEAMARFQEARTDAYGQATYDSTMAGGVEFDRATGLDLRRRQQLASEMRGEVDSYNDALLNLFGERVQRRGVDTSEAAQVWDAFNRMQQAQGQENRATAAQNFGQGITAGNYAQGLRNNQVVDELLRRGASLNEINALLTGQQVQLPGQPYGGQAGTAGAPQFLDANYLNEQASRLRNQSRNEELMGWGGLAGSVLQAATSPAGQEYIDRVLKWIENRIEGNSNRGSDPQVSASGGVPGVGNVGATF